MKLITLAVFLETSILALAAPSTSPRRLFAREHPVDDVLAKCYFSGEAVTSFSVPDIYGKFCSFFADGKTDGFKTFRKFKQYLAFDDEGNKKSLYFEAGASDPETGCSEEECLKVFEKVLGDCTEQDGKFRGGTLDVGKLSLRMDPVEEKRAESKLVGEDNDKNNWKNWKNGYRQRRPNEGNLDNENDEPDDYKNGNNDDEEKEDDPPRNDAPATPVADMGIPEDVKRQALELHNSLRARHGAAPLEWDNQLASLALKTSQKCIWAHDNRSYPVPAGQNLGGGHRSVGESIQAWYNEKIHYTNFYGMRQPPDPPSDEEEYGHFTAMIWKNTRKLGCAYYVCPKDTEHGRIFGSFITCNYSPPPNVQGQYAENVPPEK